MAGDWQVVRLDIAEALAEAAASFLDDEGLGTAVTEVRDLSSPGRATLEAHVPAARAPDLIDALTRWLASLTEIDPAAAAARVTSAPLPAVDWETVFRHHHHPLAVGARLLVAPPWDVPAASGREVLVVEPGMAFGTGQHETTRTCLEEIEEAVGRGSVRSALDVGTGSGLLAAALARLGVARVVALDLDVAVLPHARSTLARNGAAGVMLLAGGVAAIAGRFDLVVANLLADALVADAGALRAVVAPGGRLVISGILDTQADDVAAAFAPWRVTATRAAGSWRTLRLEP
jgi:ribosomal protein L11 methyltransferase